MAFLRVVSPYDQGPALSGDGVYLRPPANTDHGSWAELRHLSRQFLSPWEPLWSHDDLSRGAFKRRIRRYHRDMRDDRAYPFFIFRDHDRQIIGGVTISNIRRAVAQTCSIGYWIGEPYAHQGHMSAAVRTLIPFAFGQLDLHRIEAACLPHNQPSIGLLTKVGFTREGYARRYLKINGEWQDHILFARLADDR
ncbi:Ribosomal-protein-S5p-alanine acetyltransferase [hydrothermal vent metagenome]|uniref:Ribosomal-protein-S5p-alanine acetyltransferase n=1 Tax=hydrothermal vent metagenome TaxID=652676 RepID=A0A3B0UBG0_9ZZZZ